MYDSAIVGEAGDGVAGSANGEHSNIAPKGGGFYLDSENNTPKAYLYLGRKREADGSVSLGLNN